LFEFGFGIIWIVLSICVALDLGLDCLEGLVLIVWICFQNVWIVLIVCIASWICLDSLHCSYFVDGLDWLCDAKLPYLFILLIGCGWTVCIVLMVMLTLGFSLTF